jgi:tetratricopeptide (TPR) repeat protein
MAKRATRFFWWASGVLLLVVLGATLQVWFSTGQFWWQARRQAAAASVTPAPAASKLDPLEVRLANLEKRADDLDKRADDVEKMLTLLLGLSTVYALALGFAAYAQLKDSTSNIEKLSKSAEEKVNKLPQDIDDLFLRTQARIPMLANMNDRIHDFMQDLIQQLPIMDPNLDWTKDKYYRALSDEDKEKIFFWEKTAAVFACFDLRGRDRQNVSEIYHGFGNFYGLRYLFHDDGSGAKDGKQRDRARLYLDLAVRYDPQNSGALNDRGYLALELEDVSDREKAKKFFKASLEFDPEQQRARYDLALIAHREKDYASAVALLTEAMGKQHWQGNIAARYRSSLLYNRACAYAKLGSTKTEKEQRKKNFDNAFEDLYVLDPIWRDEEPKFPEYFRDDIEPKGDLHPLMLEQPWKGKVETLELYKAALTAGSKT